MSEAAKRPSAGDESDETGYEPDRPRTGLIFGTIAVGVVLVAGVVIGMNELYKHLFEAELSRKVYQYQGPELRELHAAEDAKLNHYQWVDGKHETLRVPLDRAKELTLAAYRAPLPPPAPAAPPPAAPAEDSASPKDKPAPDAEAPKAHDPKAPDAKPETPKPQ
jgi:hypothetical protein